MHCHEISRRPIILRVMLLYKDLNPHKVRYLCIDIFRKLKIDKSRGYKRLLGNTEETILMQNIIENISFGLTDTDCLYSL